MKWILVVVAVAAGGLLLSSAVAGGASYGSSSSHCSSGSSLVEELDVAVLHVLPILGHGLPGIGVAENRYLIYRKLPNWVSRDFQAIIFQMI